MLKPSKGIQDDYKPKQVEVGNQPKESLEVGGDEEQPDKIPLFGKPLPVAHQRRISELETTQDKIYQNPGTSLREDDLLAFKPIRIFSKFNLNRTLDLASPNIGQESSGEHQSLIIASTSSRNTDDNNGEYEDATRGLEDEHTRNPNLTGGFEACVDPGNLYNHARDKQDLNIVGRKSIDTSALNCEINERAVPEQDNEAAVIGQINNEETASSPGKYVYINISKY
jgi:hypothetical protein